MEPTKKLSFASGGIDVMCHECSSLFLIVNQLVEAVEIFNITLPVDVLSILMFYCLWSWDIVENKESLTEVELDEALWAVVTPQSKLQHLHKMPNLGMQ